MRRLNLIDLKRSLIFALFMLALGAAFSLDATADELARPQAFGASWTRQRFFHIPGARIAWVNYPALRDDFTALAHFSDQEIDHWVLENFAYLSETQLKLRGIRIDHADVDPTRSREFAHPKNYNRASIAPALLNEKQLGLVDLKGTGWDATSPIPDYQAKVMQGILEGDEDQRQRRLNTLRLSDHSDGMMSLGEAFAEVTRQRAVQAELELANAHQDMRQETVESYFVIYLPTRILKEDGQTIASAIYGRQAHLRAERRVLNELNLITKMPEIIHDKNGSFQSTLFSSFVDFGTTYFTDPRLSETYGIGFTRDHGFVPLDKQNAWRFGHQTAEYFAATIEQNPAAARAAVDHHVDSMLAPLASELAKVRPVSHAERIRRFVKLQVQRRYKEGAPDFDLLADLFWQLTPEVQTELLKDFNNVTVPYMIEERKALTHRLETHNRSNLCRAVF